MQIQSARTSEGSGSRSTLRIYSDTESAVIVWGKVTRGPAELLGLPTYSPIARLIEQARVFERKSRKTAKALTAKGVQTRVMTARTVGYIDPEVMAVDRIIAAMPNVYKKAIFRRYRYQQPDRIAAREMKVERQTYQGWVDAGLEFIEHRLALLY